jgi:hypothetical protein
VVFDKVPIIQKRKRALYSTNGVGNTDYPHGQGTKPDPYLTPYTKNNSKVDQNPKYKIKNY